MAGPDTRQRRRSADRRAERLRDAVERVAAAGVLDPIAAARERQQMQAAFLGARLTVHALLKRLVGLGVEVVLEKDETLGIPESEKLYIDQDRRGRTRLRIDG